MTVAERLRFARRERGWSQERLAQDIGVSIFSINAWERGIREPRGPARKLVEIWFKKNRDTNGAGRA